MPQKDVLYESNSWEQKFLMLEHVACNKEFH